MHISQSRTGNLENLASSEMYHFMNRTDSSNLFCCSDVRHARADKPEDKEAGTVCKNA